MTKEIFTTICGLFIIEKDIVIDKVIFKNLADYENREKAVSQLLNKHKDAKQTTNAFPRLKEYLPTFFQQNITLTKNKIRESVKRDDLIIQAVKNIEDIEKAANSFAKRLRDWISLYLPELDENITKHEKFVDLFLEKSKKELMKELEIEKSMGTDLAEKDLKPMKNLAKKIQDLYKTKESQEKYIEEVMQDICPNTLQVTGPIIGAKLLVHAGSLKKLAGMPSSTVQLLGAEKALFRHIKNKRAKCPRHGVIINHPLIACAKQKDHGKIARHLAAAISISAKVDYFGGEPTKGYELREKLEKAFGKKENITENKDKNKEEKQNDN